MTGNNLDCLQMETQFLIGKVEPAIKRKWLDNRNHVIRSIQQDGASSHTIEQEDPEFEAAATTGNWEITLVTQQT
jgi:hypothetical protein